jgi:hypothetical protein
MATLMAHLSVVVNVVAGSGIGCENRLSHVLRVLPITQTSSAHYRATKKVLRVRSSHAMETSYPLCHSCELVPAVPSPPPRSSTGTTGSARSLRTLPRLPPCQPIHHLSRSTCEALPPPCRRLSSSFHTANVWGERCSFLITDFIDGAGWCTSHLSDCSSCPYRARTPRRNKRKTGILIGYTGSSSIL